MSMKETFLGNTKLSATHTNITIMARLRACAVTGYRKSRG
jgi:hypothetical protein